MKGDCFSGCRTPELSAVRGNALRQSASSSTNMADFDAIYEEQDESNSILDTPDVSVAQDPVVIRGAGNITV